MRSMTPAFLAVLVAFSLTWFNAHGVPPAGASGGLHRVVSSGWKAVSNARVSSAESPHGAYRSGGYSSETLVGVDALSTDNVWTIGNSIEHWNGKKWRVYKPVRAAGDQQLDAIASVSPKDIWVVGGDSSFGGDGAGRLINHWNGKRWTEVPAPKSDLLYAVSVSPTGDVWAAGAMPVSDAEDEAYSEHWNGQKWIGRVLPVNNMGCVCIPDELWGIAAISSNDVLAVGRNGYAAQWNGNQWTVVEPTYGNAIAAVSATDAWAVGGGIEHWNGVSWSAVPLTLPANWFPMLESVSAVGPNDAWAVGQMYRLDSEGDVVRPRALVAHWNGTDWTYDPTLAVKAGFSELTGISTLPNGDAWAVGSYGKAYGSVGKKLRPLIEHYVRR